MVNDSVVLPWYKQRWPWLLMAGPAAVIVAGVVTVWLAVVSNDGLVVDDYYKQGLAVNQRLQRDQQASVLGLTADLMRSGQRIRLLMTSNDAGALPAELSVKLSHPTRSGQDQTVHLRPEAAGFYAGKLEADISGRWIVTIEDPAARWRLHGEWQAESEDPLRLTAKH